MNAKEIAKEVIKIEIEGLEYMSNRINDNFDQAIKAIISTAGRTIICGMGKSGIIGKKIAASFASTGTPSFFMHPGEAFHGDLGMVKSIDVFIAISNSGETDEVLKLLPFLRDNGNYIIAITGRSDSTLAKNAHCHLDIAVPKEACPLQLAPTSSTTATLVMGDALTVALMDERNFKPENFARFHPGGNLGRRLLSKVRDEMIVDNLPLVNINADFSSIINTISSGQLGLALILGLNDQLEGIITDGDIRRSMETYGKDVFDLKAVDIITLNPLSITQDTSIQVAYEFMHTNNVTSLVVLDGNSLVGVIKK
ncbi:KpsF/GutQ family sugar-phosphate isomerase [Photobacterium sp. S4TG1]|uniref:KpsF/GutQ family sugar-phosphate isomerase n=1 Tax=Photobacterium sp. S4TG1 TaxID=3114587 RepID=UPI002E199D80|nr:KpsF/GutQ family sugar-phosphate isomerase [Photobacterium sp. S4TG1]